MPPPFTSIGIDVSKKKLDIYHHGKHCTIDNNLETIAKWLNTLIRSDISRIVCEATGGYEQTLLLACQQAHIPLCVVNARQVRDFARSTGTLAKTDRIDATIIAQFGDLLKPKPTTLKLDNILRALLQRRTQLVNQLKAEKQHREKITLEVVREDIEIHMQYLQTRLKHVEHTIQKHVANHKDHQHKVNLLTSCKGIGKVTALTLIAYCPELGSIQHREISALIGVAPFNWDSGGMRGQRRIRGGRKNIRDLLYMAAIAAIRSNQDIKENYKKLKDKGKASKVAIIACMRKLIIMLNAIIKRGTPWKEKIIHEF